ncbi:unnamed protein product [Closterium sp. NIES-54]
MGERRRAFQGGCLHGDWTSPGAWRGWGGGPPLNVSSAVYVAGVAAALYTLWCASIGIPHQDWGEGAAEAACGTLNERKLPSSRPCLPPQLRPCLQPMLRPCLVVALPDAALTCRRATALPFQLQPYPDPALSRAALAATAAAAAAAAATATAVMATPNVLTFDAEGRAIDFKVWVDDLQLFLKCDSRDGVSLFDLTSGVSVAHAAHADSTVRSQWTTRDAAARLDVRSHLPSAERAHFRQYKTARTLYDAFVAHYSSPATAALSRLMLPYLFPDLAAFATVADLITYLRTSDTRYRAALPAEFCASHYMVLEGMAGAAVVAVVAVEGVGEEVGVVAGVGASVAVVEVEAAEAAAVGVEVAAVAAAVGVAAAAVGVAAAAGRGGAVQRGVFGGGQRQQQQHPRETLSPQQLREWYAGRGRSGGAGPCAYALRSVDRSGETCGGLHATLHCFGRLTDAWRAQFPDATEIPRWGDLLKSGVAIFDLDYDAILAAMYAVSISTEGDCYLCVPPDPGIEAAALGASESTAPGAGEVALSGTASAQVLHTFTLDSGASRSFFHYCTTLSPLSRPVAVSLADPSGGPVLAHSSTVLPCPAVPSGSLSGLHLPSFSMNLVSGADLQDAWVDQFTPGGQRVTHCSCTQTRRHLATFTRQPGSSLYTLNTMSPLVGESGQVAASGQVFTIASRSGPESAPCSCRLLSHQTLLWHHSLGHPSLPHLQGMASCVLVTGLPRSLPPLPPGPAPTCVPCIEGQQRAAPHSSSFPLMEAPLQTLHMDVRGPARVHGQGHERYFLLVVDDYLRYTTVFPLRSKGGVTEVLIDRICAARRQLSESFGSDLPVLRLHSDRGGEFSSDLLRAFCRAEGIRQMFTLPASPQKNGIAEHRIGMVMDVTRTSMIHAATPHFLWPFAVQYTAHQINLQPRVSMPETTPTLRWTGKVGDSSAFRVWGSRAFVGDLSADKLSSRAVPYVFLGFPSRLVGSSTTPPRAVFCPLRTSRLTSVSQVDAVEPVEVAVDFGAARGVEPAGAGSGGAEPERAEPGGAESRGAEPGVDESGGAEPEGAEPARLESGGVAPGGPSRASSRWEPLSLQQLREWFAQRWSRAAGAGSATGAGGSTAAGAARDSGVTGLIGARTGGTGAAGPGGATGAGGAGAGGTTGAGAAGGTGAGATGAAEASGGSAGAGGAAGAGAPWGAGDGATRAAGGAAGAGGVGPDTGGAAAVPAGGLTQRREPASHPALPVCAALTSRRGSRQRPPSVPGTHQMALRPSTAPQRVPLPSPPASSLLALVDPPLELARAPSPTVTRLLATVVTNPLFESTAASALVPELVDFAAHCRSDYLASLVAESESVCPPSVEGECALSTDVLEDRHEEFQCFAVALPHLVSMLLAPEGDPDAPDIPTPRSYAEAIEGPYSSQWQTAMDAEMASWKSTGNYVDEVPPPGANIVNGMWIFRVKRPPGSPPVFKACYVARGFSQTTLAALGFAPSTADPSVFLRTDTTLPPFYILVYVDNLVFATADTAGLAHVKSELQKRHTCSDLGELRSYLGLQITRDKARRTITLTQSHMVQQVLQRFGFTYSSPQATPLSTRHSLSAVPSDESVEPNGPYPELVGCLLYLMTCTRSDLAYPLSILARYVAPRRHRPEHMDTAKRVLRYLCSTSGMGLVLGGWARVVLTGHADASWVDDLATQRSSQGYTCSLGSGTVLWRSTHSSSILCSSCEAKIFDEAMAAQELRWLTYLLTDLGEARCSPPVLYVDNKAMLALYQEHRLEHRTKHIALRYFLAQELQQRGQLRLAYVATRANCANIFTKALQPCDH